MGLQIGKSASPDRYHSRTIRSVNSMAGSKYIPGTRILKPRIIDFMPDIALRYLSGESSTSIARFYNKTPASILWGLRQAGVPTRQGGHRVYAVDHDFFSRIDTEAKAYALGFISADGHLDVKSRTLIIALQQRDEEHLLTLRGLMGSTAKIFHRDCGASHTTKTYPQAIMSITSGPMAQNLIRWGITQQKTQELTWPTDLPSHLMRHYLRGFIDGDGSLIRFRDGRLAFSVSGVVPVISGIQSFLMDACGLRMTTLSNRPMKNGLDFVTLSYAGRHQVTQIFHVLYDDATLWLPRKRLAVEPYLCPYCTTHRCAVKRIEDTSSRSGDNNWTRRNPDKTTKGSLNRHAKLDEEDIPIIRALRAAGVPTRYIALGFVVHTNTIQRVNRRSHWKHVA